MKPTALTILLLLLLLISGPQAAASPLDTAYKWAPVVYEQTGATGTIAQENVFTRINYDHDWRSNNNRQNLSFYPPERTMYYSLTETATHYYIGYYLYYPRGGDDKDREHYFSGVLAVVRKQADGTATLDGFVTYNRLQYRWLDGAMSGKDNGRPALTVAADNHYLQVLGRDQRLPALGRCAPLPQGQEEQAASSRPTGTSHDGYRLVPLEEIWQRRSDIGPGHTYGQWGVFDTNIYSPGAAALPWIWEYKNANWLADPAALVGQLRGTAAVSTAYVANPYEDAVRAHRVGR